MTRHFFLIWIILELVKNKFLQCFLAYIYDNVFHLKLDNNLAFSPGPGCCRQTATAVPGRLLLRMTTMSYEVTDSVAIDDEEQCRQLLQKYRQLVSKGDLCGGDCPNDGMSCSSGVCRSHLR